MTELVKKDEGGLAVIPGLEDVDREDMVIPTLYPDGKEGFFRDSLDENATNRTITGVLLTFNKGWKLREGDPPKTTCRSQFGDVGSHGTSCEGCPRRKRVEGQRDYCKRVYDLLFIPEGQSLPTIISVGAVTSLGNVKKYITLFSKKLQRPFFAAQTKLTLVKDTNARGQSYYVLTFEKLGDTDGEEMIKFNQLMQLYRSKPTNEEIVKDDLDEAVDINESLGNKTPF